MVYNKEYFENRVACMLDKIKNKIDYTSLDEKDLQIELSFLIMQSVTFIVFDLFRLYIKIDPSNYKLYFDIQEIVDTILFCMMAEKQFNLDIDKNKYKITHTFKQEDYDILVNKIRNQKKEEQ